VFAVPDLYVDAVRRAGGRIALLTTPDGAEAKEVLDPFDGLLLLGGGDVEPHRYGAPEHPTLYGLEPDRDDLELRLAREADARGMPTLAICRGFQVANVAFGGTLVPHLPDVEGTEPHGTPGGGTPVLHDVDVEAGSRLADVTGARTLSCASHHHQAVDRLGDGLLVTGRTSDGVVEAFERPGGWFVGVQWHPEDTAAEDPAQQRIFDALVRSAAART
jgi:putative glutamine amidotransferase